MLVDAPCTSSGVIRRHPGLRWSKQWAGTSQAAKDARALPLLQRRLLVDAASLLRDGGRLVYATCALERSQNEHVAEWFEQHFPGFEPLPFDDGMSQNESYASPAQNRPHYRTLWPHHYDTDGFFIARWQRSSRDSDA